MPTRDLRSFQGAGDDAGPLEAALDALPARISVWDRDLRFCYGNAAAVGHLGRSAVERGEHLRDFADHASLEAQLPFLQRALAGESVRFRTVGPAPCRSR